MIALLKLLAKFCPRVSSSMLTYWSASIFLTLVSNCAVLQLKTSQWSLHGDHQRLAQNLSFFVISVSHCAAILSVLCLINRSRKQIHKVVTVNCYLIGSYFVLRGFTYVLHGQIDFSIGKMSQTRAVVYLATVLALFTFFFLYGRYRSRSKGPDPEAHHNAGSSLSSSVIEDESSDDEHMMIEIRSESEINMNGGPDELIY